jgi:hypothetical protein
MRAVIGDGLPGLVRFDSDGHWLPHENLTQGCAARKRQPLGANISCSIGFALAAGSGFPKPGQFGKVV